MSISVWPILCVLCSVGFFLLGYRAASKFGMDKKEKKARMFIASIVFFTAKAVIFKERLKRNKKSEVLQEQFDGNVAQLAETTAEFCMFIGARTKKTLDVIKDDTKDIIINIEGDSTFITFIKGLMHNNDFEQDAKSAYKEGYAVNNNEL